MSFHPTDLQGSVIDALRESIEQQVRARAAVKGGGGHCSIEVTSPACVELGFATRSWPRAIEVQLTIGVPT
jgi:hypothetical protein